MLPSYGLYCHTPVCFPDLLQQLQVAVLVAKSVAFSLLNQYLLLLHLLGHFIVKDAYAILSWITSTWRFPQSSTMTAIKFAWFLFSIKVILLISDVKSFHHIQVFIWEVKWLQNIMCFISNPHWIDQCVYLTFIWFVCYSSCTSLKMYLHGSYYAVLYLGVLKSVNDSMAGSNDIGLLIWLNT